jgi:hypothetical protein
MKELTRSSARENGRQKKAMHRLSKIGNGQEMHVAKQWRNCSQREATIGSKHVARRAGMN